MHVKISTLVTWAALLILTQLLISQWTVHAAGNRDVIDYVSFAGTVVGMILAVLAIVYSYLADSSRKGESEAIRNQVQSLNDAISRAAQSGDQFSVEIGRLEEIRASLSQVSANSAASMASSARTEQVISEFAARNSADQKAAIDAATNSDTLVEDDYLSALVRLASLAVTYLPIAYYCSVLRIRSAESATLLFNRLVKQAMKPELRTGRFFVATEGEFEGYYYVLKDLLAGEQPGRDVFLREVARTATETIEKAKAGELELVAWESKGLVESLEEICRIIESEVGRD